MSHSCVSDSWVNQSTTPISAGTMQLCFISKLVLGLRSVSIQEPLAVPCWHIRTARASNIGGLFSAAADAVGFIFTQVGQIQLFFWAVHVKRCPIP